MKKYLLIIVALVLSIASLPSFAQNPHLPDGSIAPNFTFTDMNGKVQDLYSYLNAGKSVVIDIFSTWCYPCWKYHSSGELEKFYDQKGPDGTNEVMVIGIEADGATNDGCIINSSDCMDSIHGNSMGNWLDGTPYPVCNPPDPYVDPFRNSYENIYFPNMYLICAADKKTKLVDQLTAVQLDSVLALCPSLTATKNLDLSSYVSVFPTPSSGNVFVNINTTVNMGAVNVKIYNVIGEEVYPPAGRAGSTLTIDLSSHPDGMYFIEIQSGNAMTTKKIVLNHNHTP